MIRLLLAAGRWTSTGSSTSCSGAHAFPAPIRRRGSSSAAKSRPGRGSRRVPGTPGPRSPATGSSCTPSSSRRSRRPGGSARTSRCWSASTWTSDVPPEEQPLLADLAATAAEWQERGADELIFHWIHPHQLDAVLAAGERAGLEQGRREGPAPRRAATPARAGLRSRRPRTVRDTLDADGQRTPGSTYSAASSRRARAPNRRATAFVVAGRPRPAWHSARSTTPATSRHRAPPRSTARCCSAWYRRPRFPADGAARGRTRGAFRRLGHRPGSQAGGGVR